MFDFFLLPFLFVCFYKAFSKRNQCWRAPLGSVGDILESFFKSTSIQSPGGELGCALSMSPSNPRKPSNATGIKHDKTQVDAFSQAENHFFARLPIFLYSFGYMKNQGKVEVSTHRLTTL